MRANERRAPRFDVVEPQGRVVFWIWMLCVVLPVAVTGVALGMILLGIEKGAPQAQEALPLLELALVLVGVHAIVIPLAVWLQRSLRRIAVEFDGATLQVRAGWYRLGVEVSGIDAAQARVVHLDEHKEYRPVFQPNAMSVPGYRVGHYRLRDPRRKAFVLLTTRDRIAMLPLRDGRIVLLSLRQPQRLIDALREAAG